MVYEIIHSNKSINATDSLVANQFCFVSLDANGQIVLASGDAVGVLQDKPGPDDPGFICGPGDITKCRCGATVNPGDALTCDAFGRAIPANGGGPVLGYALAPGALDALAPILFQPAGGAGGGGGSTWTSDVNGGGFSLSNAGDIDITGSFMVNGVSITAGGGAQTPWLQNVDAANFSLTGLSSLGVAGNAAIAGNVNITGASPQYLINGVPFTGTPAGANGQVQFNSAGAFGASANLTWDATAGLTVNGPGAVNGVLTVAGNINITGTPAPQYLINGVAFTVPSVTVSATAPASPPDGVLWFDTSILHMFLRAGGTWFQVS